MVPNVAAGVKGVDGATAGVGCGAVKGVDTGVETGSERKNDCVRGVCVGTA